MYDLPYGEVKNLNKAKYNSFAMLIRYKNTAEF
jgi:hypothetical protein